jgi:drug/metabolite transporter (DMT)-like permease
VLVGWWWLEKCPRGARRWQSAICDSLVVLVDPRAFGGRGLDDLENTNLSWVGFVMLSLTALLMAVANLLIKNGIARAVGFSPSLLALFQLLRQPAVVVGLLLTGISALLWFRILASQKLSTCYPLFVSLTYSFITLGAFYFLHEKLSIQKLAGLVVIIIGITVVARG